MPPSPEVAVLLSLVVPFSSRTLHVVTAAVTNARSSNMNFILLLLITAMNTEKKRIRII